jgi:hypothetical protein
VWATKHHADTSFVMVAAAEPDTQERLWPVVRTAVTEASASSAAFKQQIHEQLRGAAALSP